LQRCKSALQRCKSATQQSEAVRLNSLQRGFRRCSSGLQRCKSGLQRCKSATQQSEAVRLNSLLPGFRSCNRSSLRCKSATQQSEAVHLITRFHKLGLDRFFFGWTRIFDPRVFDPIQVFPGTSVDLSISELSLLLNQIQLNLIKFIINTNSN
jgi:hypothetical protein